MSPWSIPFITNMFKTPRSCFRADPPSQRPERSKQYYLEYIWLRKLQIQIMEDSSTIHHGIQQCRRLHCRNSGASSHFIIPHSRVVVKLQELSSSLQFWHRPETKRCWTSWSWTRSDEAHQSPSLSKSSFSTENQLLYLLAWRVCLLKIFSFTPGISICHTSIFIKKNLTWKMSDDENRYPFITLKIMTLLKIPSPLWELG